MILKAVALLVLGLIGLLVVLILIALLSAIRYRFSMSCYETGQLQLSISYLFRLVRFQYQLEAGQSKHRVILFGIELGKKKKRKTFSRTKDSEPVQEDSDWDDELDREGAEEAKELGIETEKIETEASETEPKHSSEKSQKSKKKAASGSGKEKKKKSKKGHPYKETKKLKDKTEESDEDSTEPSRWTKLQEDGEWVLDFIGKPSVKKLIRSILKKNGRMIRHVLPRKVKANIHFGLGDPALTGEVLAAASVFYALYYRSVILEADFDQRVLEGEADIAGHIRLGYLLWLLLRIGFSLILNREVRNFYHQAKERKIISKK